LIDSAATTVKPVGGVVTVNVEVTRRRGQSGDLLHPQPEAGCAQPSQPRNVHTLLRNGNYLAMKLTN
jgi:hypothetical protein